MLKKYFFLLGLVFLSHSNFSQPFYHQPKHLNIESAAGHIGLVYYSNNAYGLNLSIITSYKANGMYAWKTGIELNALELLKSSNINSNTTTGDATSTLETKWSFYPLFKFGMVFVPTQISFLRKRNFLSNPRKRAVLENGTYLKAIYLEHIRVYLDYGVSLMLFNDLTARKFDIPIGDSKIVVPYSIGVYGSAGIEFSFNDVENTFGSFFIEIGGAYSGISTAPELTPRSPASGLMINTGFRFYPTRGATK